MQWHINRQSRCGCRDLVRPRVKAKRTDAEYRSDRAPRATSQCAAQPCCNPGTHLTASVDRMATPRSVHQAWELLRTRNNSHLSKSTATGCHTTGMAYAPLNQAAYSSSQDAMRGQGSLIVNRRFAFQLQGLRDTRAAITPRRSPAASPRPPYYRVCPCAGTF